MSGFFSIGKQDWPGLLLLGVLLCVAGAMAARRAAGEPPVRSPGASDGPGREMLVVFLGSSTCGASQAPGLPEGFRRMRGQLYQKAGEHGLRPVMVGVATDWDLAAGQRFLGEFGPFDEVMIGRGWLNHGMARYVWSGHAGEPAVPQVIVLVRDIVPIPGAQRLEIRDERILLRKVGIAEFRRWQEAGFPLPSTGGGPDERASHG